MHPITTVALVDDYPPALEKLLHQLKFIPGIKIVAVHSSGLELIEKCHHVLIEPDIVIVDYHMNEIDGVTLIDYFNFYYPKTKCICISGYNDLTTIEEVFNVGAYAFITKQSLRKEILEEALVTVNHGKVFISLLLDSGDNETASLKYAEEVRKNSLKKSDTFRLTKREKIFAILNATALSYRQIADVLCVDVRTVETTGYRLSKKAGIIGGRRSLVISSIKEGWIKLASFTGIRKNEL